MRRKRWTWTAVDHDGVTLSVRSSGPDDGRRTVVLLTGLGAPQQVWDRVASRLVGDYRVVTFDYRGHARSGPADSHTFDDFLGDVSAVLRATAGGRPILCGWSLGADLAVWHAARAPETCAGIVALDGAIPTEPVDPDDDDDAWAGRRMNGVVARIGEWISRKMKMDVRVPVEQLLHLGREVDRRREHVLDAYAALSCPVAVALGERPGPAPDPQAAHARWRAGGDRLAAALPHVPVTWLDSDHAIPVRRPGQVAELVTRVAVQARSR
ncbi:hypothetical protein GCM10010156_66850 [Planobispora rosea]|uniref:AB hydrolase-1 domain-containing protein n=1 Tax=Planobispora rosea TaxID=35762 RepID=A0A8J3S8L8_PLARO|nr:alpha/beta hydrolase [Planobispora rosea]GGS99407.1 hypothetical protein GCM10010156_66850 [Planobispora rosea]GIH88047.1 hypothetical protein Pro02_64550 [Planobispora rosea]